MSTAHHYSSSLCPSYFPVFTVSSFCVLFFLLIILYQIVNGCSFASQRNMLVWGGVVIDVFEKHPKELNSIVHKMSLSLKHLNSQQEFGHLELSRDINSQDDEKEPTLSFDQKIQLKKSELNYLAKPGKGTWERGDRRGSMPPMCSRVMAWTTSISRRYLE